MQEASCQKLPVLNSHLSSKACIVTKRRKKVCTDIYAIEKI